mgnify:FL=1
MANLKYKNSDNQWKSLSVVRGPKGDNADITLNGTSSNNISIYAPVSSGLSGQILQSNGANKNPTWIEHQMPTVNNAILDIQKNGTSLGTFSANANENKTINIEVPIIENSLVSTDISKALSANQGKILNDKFANYLPLTGGVINGTVTANDLRANIDSGESSVLAAYQNKGIYLFANENSHGIYDNFFGPTMALEGTGITDKHFYGTATAAEQDTSGLNLAGAIIGGNRGGDNFYIKYSNGILICVKRVSFSNLPISSAWGNLYEYSGSINLGNWPYAFAYTPATSITVQSQSGLIVEGHQSVSTSSAGTVWISRPTTSTGVSGCVSVIAIGKWKTDTTGGTIHEPEKTT